MELRVDKKKKRDKAGDRENGELRGVGSPGIGLFQFHFET